MRTTRNCLVTLVAMAIAACHGDGSGEANDPPPTDTPAPPPSPGNQAPVANAGEDQATVEEQDVTVDGSRTRDPENDRLTYAWELMSAPDGSGVSVHADTPTFVFRPDLPGTYQLQLIASDGRSTSSDTMRVRAEALFSFDDEVEFKIDKRGRGDERRELDVKTSSLYRGEPVVWTAESDASWLRVLRHTGLSASPGDHVSIRLELVMSEVERLPEGEHEAHVTVKPIGGWEPVTATVTLELDEHGGDGSGSIVVPYVLYTGQPASVSLHGDDLIAANGASVVVNDSEVAYLQATSDARATIEMPALAAGVHAVRVGSAGDLSRVALRIVVRDEPIHRAAELALPGVTRSLEYDAERDAFYAVFMSADGTRVARRLQNSGSGNWASDAIPVDSPWAVALTADGAELLVTSEGCTVHRLEPRTLSVLQSFTKASCDPGAERLGTIATLADGRVLVANDAGSPDIWAYPHFTPLDALPSKEDPLLVLNADRTRLPWADRSFPKLEVAMSTHTQPESRTYVSPSGKAAFHFTAEKLYVRELH